DALEGSTVNLNGVTLSSSDSTAIVKNDGTLNFTGNTSTINASITGSNGITNIDTAVDIVSESGYAITQKTVNVNDGGTLSVFNNAKIAADLVINDGGNAYVGVLSITKDVTNDGGLHLYGATALTKAIDGAGTTYIYNNANITNEGGINQAVTVTSGSTLINEAALGSAEGKITNAGTITSNADYIRGAVENNNALSLLGGELSKAVTGSGTTTITDSMTNSGGINQSVVVNENVTLTNKSALGSETGNITNAGTITSNADYINGAVENNNALSLLGGELAKVVTGSGTTTVSGNTTNAGGINQAVTVTSGSTLTNKAALGSEEGKITNAGTITSNANYINGAVENNNALSLLGGELAKAVTGSGTTTVSGNTTNSGGINQAVVVEENVTLTNKAALGSETGKITNSGTIISSADDINGVVENNNALKLSGGELVKAVTGLGTTTITDSMTNSGGINQAVVVNENVTLTNKAALGSEEGKITNAGVINTSAANINGVVENNNNLTLTEGTLDKAVSGAGTTNVIGEVINEAVISQNVAISSTGNLTNNNKIGNVVNDGILTSDTSNLTGTIRNNKTLNLTGTLDKAVTGNGTTYVGEDLTLTLVNGADIEGVLNASSGSTILVSGSGTDRYGIGRLTGNGDVEVTGGNLTIRNKASLHNLTNSGTTTIEGTLVATGDILNNSNSNLTINGNTKAENVTNKGDMDVLGSLVVDEKLYNSGTLDIAGKLQANEVENDNGTINVEENATLDVAGDLTTNEDITTSGNLWVVGDITAKNLTNEGDLSVGGDVDVTTLTNKDNADIAGDVTAKDLINEENAILSIEKNAEVETLTNAGTATIDGDLIASGNVSNTKLLSVGKDLTTEGDVINNGTLEVTGSVSAVNITTKNATVHGDLTASSNVTTTKSLTVDGHVTANNFTNDTDGVVTLKQGAEVNDFTNKGTATVTGNLAANEVDNKKSLEVSGSLTAKSDITNDTDATLIIKNGAEVGDLTNKGTTTVTGKVTASDVTNEKTLTFNSGAEINDMLNSGAATVVNGFVANDITNSSILNVQGGTVSINNVINTSTLNISDKAKVILQTKITGEGGKVNITDSSITTNGNIRNQEVSATNSKLTLGDNGDVLKTSKLNLKNSTLDTRDNVFTNYIIDEIHATSDSRFSIDINLSRDEQNSDTFTLANGGSGVIYLSSLKVTNNCEDNEIYKIQIIKSGRDDAPQLAYDNSKVLDHANAHMRDDMLFAKNFGLVTTDTLNDTIEIRGWRDTFGEWADFKVDEDKSFTFVNDETYQLSRDVLGFEGINGTIIGQNKTFDIDNHVWFEEIKEDQTIKITDLNIVNNKGEMNNKGHLLLDNVLLDKDIQNNKTLELKNRVVLEKVTNNADLSYEGEILTIKDLTNNSNVVIDATKALIGKLVNNSETTIDGSLLSPSIKNNAEGTLKVTDDVTAETVTNNGVAELGKDLTVSGKLTTTKSLAVSGKLSSDMVENEGVLEVGSGLQTKEILNKGTAAVTGKTVSETLTNSGNMTLTGDVLSKSITNEDTLTITGDLTAAGITNNKELNVNESAINVGKISAKESGDLNITNSTLNAYDTIKNQNITATKSTMNIVNPYYMINDSLRMLDSTLNMGELEIKPLHINTMDLTNSTINIASSKVDFDSNTMGRITSDTVISDNSTIINLNNLNPQNYPSKEVELVKIPFADTTYSGNVSYNGQTSLQAPIYKYGISYDPRTGDMVFVRGGSYNPNTGKIEHSTNPSDQFNPNVLSTGVAAHTAATSTMNQVYNYVFQNSDNFMHYPLADRMAVINRDKYALNEMPAMMDETVPFESAIGMNSEGSSWFKPYVNFETVDYKKGPRVHATNYGSLAGFDSSIRTYKNGWSGAYTGYVGYTGSMQSFGGIHSNQNGALVGGTFTLYKGNFFSATTLSAGVNLAETNSGLGHDDITMLLGGAANKTGYNFEFKEGRYIFQPNVMVSYTFVNAFNYINTSGVEIKSDPMHTIQVAPGFRMMANTKRGWQPYIAVNMVMNFMDKAKVSADDIRLPGMSTRPYVQYGIGVQKTFKDNFMAFGQTMFQSGGRHGVTLTAGFRWMLDSKPKTKDKVEIKNDQLVKTIKGSPLVGSIKEVKIQKESQTQYEQLESGKTIIKQLSKQTVPQRGYKTTQTAIRGTLKQI
ncbi:hypothetical protein HDR58_10410, partial [bacterium]|nr:hypothetical protein [bacterium]